MKKFVLLLTAFAAFAAILPAVATIGVTVNGTDISAGSGADPAWAYDSGSGSLELTAAGASYVISGNNIQGATTNAVSVQAQADCTVVASNLVIDVSGTGDFDTGTNGLTAFDCGTHTVILALWSNVGQVNVFKGGAYCAGITVASNETDVASLVITNLNESAALSAQGGSAGAGIGGGNYVAGGTVMISGGSVSATGGGVGAGIGGGGLGAGGTVTISGGT